MTERACPFADLKRAAWEMNRLQRASPRRFEGRDGDVVIAAYNHASEQADRAARNIAHALAVVAARESGWRAHERISDFEARVTRAFAEMKRLEEMGK